MAIELQETFQVKAPIERVWKFMMDPESVAACMPGASLDEIVDERTFIGNIKLKVGAVTTNYKGKIHFENIDETNYTIQMVAEGKEKGGGTVKGTVSSNLRILEDGQTEVIANTNIELTGKIMQVGRGMIEGVSKQLFKKFAANTKKRLEVEEIPAVESTRSGDTLPPQTTVSTLPAEEDDSIAIIPLLFKTLLAAIANFFRKLFGKPTR